MELPRDEMEVGEHDEDVASVAPYAPIEETASRRPREPPARTLARSPLMTAAEIANGAVSLPVDPDQFVQGMLVRHPQSGLGRIGRLPAATTLKDCWALVDMSEKTRRHCVMLENCCYGYNEMTVLNMVRGGVFGELTHAEAAYIHNLRGLLIARSSFHKGPFQRHRVGRQPRRRVAQRMSPLA